MSEPQHVIWDGRVERIVSASEARMLEEKDMAQDMTARPIAGHEFKTRAQFSGYATRELRAETPPVRVVEAPTSPPPNTQGAEHADGSDWRAYRSATAEWLGIQKATKVRKAQVMEYLKAHGLDTE
jgi:hypothetical protein